ncbi:hypothetical protein C7448_10260 [Tenacibaculum gallaicum]|uniref:Uncharacterized protein n=1 Tax=Tenacibaculum gallaicum TaxID=561505 RepID=A0A3E0I7C3_9FLAO|nr:hypothetical protein [Tenacibaculum gallaicum]REH54540.1 hypothetical protein C7448_10260 [Tenacibaculum gallaicum]
MKKKLIILGIIGMFIGGVLLYNNHIENKYPTSKSSHKKETSTYFSNEKAAYAAQKFVERQLKSPSTAKFPSLNKSKVEKSNNEYKISSYVDSQNGFGAMIRSNYTVKLRKKENGNISLININIK